MSWHSDSKRFTEKLSHYNSEKKSAKFPILIKKLNSISARFLVQAL